MNAAAPTMYYKRGQGWIYHCGPTIKLKDCEVRLEIRMPEIGESYGYLYQPDPDYFTGDDGRGEIKQGYLAEQYRNRPLHNFRVMDADDLHYCINDGFDETRIFYVLVPL